MKQVLFIVSALIILCSCNQSASTGTITDDSASVSRQSSTQSREERNKQIAVNGVNGFINGDTTYLSQTNPNCIDYNDGTMPPIKGLDSIGAINTKMMDSWRTAFPDMKMKVTSALSHGDTVMVWEEYHAHQKEILWNKSPPEKHSMCTR